MVRPLLELPDETPERFECVNWAHEDHDDGTGRDIGRISLLEAKVRWNWLVKFRVSGTLD